MLLVGNHSGGNLTPDTTVFTLAFSTYFGVERRFHQLAHNLVLSMPGLGFLRKYGTVAATPANAERALDQGAALLVYPGGDYEVHRPSWESASVDFDGRKGFIRLAKQKDVPIVPVVVRRRPGDGALPDPRRGARPAAAPRPHVPAQGPADLAVAALGAERRRHARPHPAARQDHGRGARADRRERAGRGRGLRASSSSGCSAPSPRSRPTAASRCSDEDREDNGHRRRAGGDLGAGRRPVHLSALHGGRDAGEAQGRRARARRWAPATRCTCASGRPRSAAWSRSSSSTSRPTSPGPASPGSTSGCAGGCARPTTRAHASHCGWPTTPPVGCSGRSRTRCRNRW